MNIIRARILGYCMGVRRAADIAWRSLGTTGNDGNDNTVREPRARVFTMGPLIHNPQVLEDLARRGVEILDEARLPPDFAGGTVIIRAHGITPALEETLRARGARIADATCPRVKASQMKARALSEAGYTVFLAGEKRHGEIIGIAGYAPRCIVVGGAAEAEAAAHALKAAAAPAAAHHAEIKTALLAQTTLSPEEFSAIGAAIKKYFPETEVVHTICGATRERQDALRELCAQVDAVLVVGGRGSANTRRLLALAESAGRRAWLVEGPGEIPGEIAACGAVGLSAGASTPEDVIDAVEAALRAFAPGFVKKAPVR
ncbi:MAG: 4-hydroxy-3-methylbut-2-enyl diphosphate reductase [Spirochaetaceae bacterium]|jgi:4-hydroxy-3-methylbut-2-enyl diphosphate reductase|nr:4-hydroxy-3-methylbut-2-enyl diphosphate reductase [Spirochaetaceae bacterium]